jgi:HprK-related kinase A
VTADRAPAGTIEQLGERDFVTRLREHGLAFRLGPFDVLLRNDVRHIETPLFRLYRDYPVLDADRVFSFHARLTNARALRRLHRPLVRFTVDGRVPHEDLPRAHALAVLEWGLNLVIALRSHSLLMLHAAAVERFGGVLLLPALPGHGKTTLCAGLVHRGWRLFSDEFGLVRPAACDLLPLPRPMPLKNESIEIIRAFAPDAEIGPLIPNTRKGTIAHVKPPAASVRAAETAAKPRWIVFPRWEAGAAFDLTELAKMEAFMLLATNAFNYEMLGESAFNAVCALVEGARVFGLVYSDLAEAVERLTALAAEG